MLGVTRQIIGEPWLRAHGFQYAGSIGLWPVSAAVIATLERLGDEGWRAVLGVPLGELYGFVKDVFGLLVITGALTFVEAEFDGLAGVDATVLLDGINIVQRDAGDIVERGSHDELVAPRGQIGRLLENQDEPVGELLVERMRRRGRCGEPGDASVREGQVQKRGRVGRCEHVLDEAARIASTLLAECPQVRILGTSREVLHVAGEVRIPVAPLRSAAVELFNVMARRNRGAGPSR
mgnify:CR=1 FL=1